MNTQHQIDGLQLKDMFTAGCKWLKVHIAQVNALNVFPVPDGDTGTNMFLTLEAALNKINTYSGTNAGDVAALASQGALMGARGNSGVILSQILYGFSEALANKESFNTTEFAQALQTASSRAYKAVIEPVEGTILTVIKETARRSEQAAPATPQPDHFLADILATARQTLQATPELLPILKEAGVVDSGGQGLVYILEGMERSLIHQPIDIELSEPAHSQNATAHFASAASPHEPGGYGYDVQFLIRGQNLDIDSVRETIINMGECPLVVGDKETIKVHVHVPDPGVPLSYGVTQGILMDVVVENMEEQSREFFARKMLDAETPADIAVVSVAPGEGLVEVFKSLGAGAVINGGQTMNPSTQDFLAAINHLHANNILILPNNSNIILTAQQASSMTEKDVYVVPAKTIPQGINAMLAFNAGATLETNNRQMHHAITQVQTIEITQAVRDTTINGVQVKNGDIIGLLNDVLVATGQNATEVCLAVMAQTGIDSAEIATIYYGQDCTQTDAGALVTAINAAHPHLEVETINGGQPHYYYIISLE